MFLGEKKITLYHSTDGLALQEAKAMGQLFGHESLQPTREDYSKGANLTPDKKASREFIVIYRGEGQWTIKDGAPDLYTLIFKLPRSLVKYVGKTHLFGCEEYATLLTVDARDISESYFKRQHAGTGMHPMLKATAIALQEQGKIRFYKVPFEFLIKTDPVCYTYKGICYPK